MNRKFHEIVALALLIAGTNLCQNVGNVVPSQSARFDKDLIEKSEAIVVANVASAHSFWGKDSLIWTRYTLSTQERLKGSLTGSFSIEAKGGEVGKVGMSNSNSPRFVQGKMYLLFLKNDETGKRVVVDNRGAVALVKNNARSRHVIKDLKSQIQTIGKEKKNVNK